MDFEFRARLDSESEGFAKRVWMNLEAKIEDACRNGLNCCECCIGMSSDQEKNGLSKFLKNLGYTIDFRLGGAHCAVVYWPVSFEE